MPDQPDPLTTRVCTEHITYGLEDDLDTTAVSTHGLTRQEIQDLIEQQHGLCAFCSKPFSGSWHDALAPVVDHDHKTHRVRGVVHHRCNLFLIGMNDLVSLELLSKYLDPTRPAVPRRSLELRVRMPVPLYADFLRARADLMAIEGDEPTYAHVLEVLLLLWRDAQKRGTTLQFVRNGTPVVEGF